MAITTNSSMSVKARRPKLATMTIQLPEIVASKRKQVAMRGTT